jgi:hypothetical protein
MWLRNGGRVVMDVAKVRWAMCCEDFLRDGTQPGTSEKKRENLGNRGGKGIRRGIRVSAKAMSRRGALLA